MKHTLFTLVTVTLLLCFAAIIVHAQGQIAPPEISGRAVYIPFPVQIKLDAKLDDWAQIPFAIVNHGPMVSKDTTEDTSYQFAVAANDENFYIVMTVVDKNIITGRHGADYWNEDSLEFYLNLSGDLGTTAYKQDIFQINVKPSDIGKTDLSALNITGTGSENAKVQGVAFKTENGWGFEASISLKDHNVAPNHGLAIGLQTQSNGASTTDRDVKLIWSAADTSDNSWKNPSLFGQGIFFQIGSTNIPTPVAVTILATAAPTESIGVTTSVISVNQTGYFVQSKKLGSLAAGDDQRYEWSLVDAAGEEVANGQTTAGVLDKASGDTLHTVDFSASTTPGTYNLIINGIKSVPFKIDNDLYTQLKTDALVYFYRSRSGIELKPEYAGSTWARPAGHLSDDNVTCYKGKDANGKNWDGCDYTINGLGGWYDAGDYGKYVVNGGITVWTLLNQYELNPQIYGDGDLTIPENSNGVPDILDEVRWEIQFLLSMQIPQDQPLAGMVFHKLHDRKWSGVPSALPTEFDNNKPGGGRYVYEPTTAATLNLAATAAQCARIWKIIDTEFADQCLAAARTAWSAAQAHPSFMAGSVPGEGGGDYTDNDVADEFYWAAAELYITTGEQSYWNYLKSSPHFKTFANMTGDAASFDWGNTAALGTISLALVPNDLDKNDVDELQKQIIAAADNYLAIIASEGYRLPISETGYVWGSNSLVLNNAIILGLAHHFTGKPEYLTGVSQSMDYIMGHNALNKSFVTGYGANPVQHPHHRFWGNQLDSGFPPPPPGVLSGGPNSDRQDPAVQDMTNVPPAKLYVDKIESYSTNEVAINWNAPLAWVTSYLDQQFNK